jgi:hypothetical protein
MIRSPFPASRREFLYRTGGGFGALALQALIQMNGARGAEVKPPPIRIDPTNPYLPRPPHFPAKATSVIFLHMVGGPSQIDTFDHKPLLQKLNMKRVPESFKTAVRDTRFANIFEECRDVVMASPFQFSQHGKSGMWVSELYPKVAEHVDDLCFIHSMQAESNNHAPACFQLHTGEVVAGKASIGSWITYGLGTENQDLPGYVLLFEAGPYGGVANYTNAYLPPAFQGTRLRCEGPAVMDLVPPPELARGQRDSLDLIRDLNMKHRGAHPGVTDLDARIASYELAYRLQTAGIEVGELDKEPAKVRASYGLDQKDPQLVKFARKCLLARRLVARGVRFVQIYSAYDRYGWDAHKQLPENHKRMALHSDQPIAALLADLKERRLLDHTLVIWAGEFGRTPMMQADNGRQHNAAGFTIWMAGGGVKPGQRIGMTDEMGVHAIQDPYGFRDLHATILAALGLRHDWLGFENGGRTERLTGAKGDARIIPGVLG